MTTRRFVRNSVLIVGSAYVLSDTRLNPFHCWIQTKIIAPALSFISSDDAELSHILAVRCASLGLWPICRQSPRSLLSQTLFNENNSQPLTFDSPILLAAGFDKNAECFPALFRSGFSGCEIGSVTPLPQPGQVKPRVFRLNAIEAVINRYGFNSQGHAIVKDRLAAWRQRVPFGTVGQLLGVNLGAQKESMLAMSNTELSLEHRLKMIEKDYVLGVEKLAPFADYVVVNVSSPNTKDLRSLQDKQYLTPLIRAVVSKVESITANQVLERKKCPVWLKVAPDMTQDQLNAVIDVALECKVDALIISNTTIARSDQVLARTFIVEDTFIFCLEPHGNEIGGLSGRPLFEPSTKMLAKAYLRTRNTPLKLIASGGVCDSEAVYAKIRAGADLVQVYTGLVFAGPGCAAQWRQELAEKLSRDGYSHMREAIGKDAERIAE